MTRNAIKRIMAALLLVPIVCSCSRIEVPRVSEEIAARCVVVASRDANLDASGWVDWLDRHMPGVVWFEWPQIDDAIRTSMEQDALLVIPGSFAMTPEADMALGDYLLAGGRLVSLGTRHILAANTNREVGLATGLQQPPISVTGALVRVDGTENVVKLEGRVMVGTSPGPAGTGGDRAGDTRWIPVLDAVRADGAPLASPGAFWLTPQAHGRHAIAGWLGLDPVREESAEFISLVTAMLEAMTRDIYLQRFGVPHFSMKAKSPQTATVRLVDRRLRDLVPVRLAVEWINERGQEVRRHITSPLDGLSDQTSINIGLAPAPPTNPERYRLRFVVRDRNDQRTLDKAEQSVKVFPSEPGKPVMDPITVNAGQLMQGRRPMFMFGANYWPRLSVPLMQRGQHWLHAGWFDPAMIESDLDAMVSVGFNAIAFEYTDADQAPQVRFVLDELRRRSMWACIYVPALHPLDARLDEARAMLDAIDLAAWPEVFALEVARGFAVLPQVERRRLDAAWGDWVEEHFSSTDDAELKLGISLWRERGRLTGPSDNDIRRGPQQDRAIALYYSFLRDHISRRLAFLRRWKQDAGYDRLITARSAYGWPGEAPADVLDVLDISTGAIHLDFLFPDAWTIHPLRSAPQDGDVLAAYVRGAGLGKPVVWSSYGQPVGSRPDPSSYQRQKEVVAHFLDMFVRQEASGAFVWWYPPGMAGPVTEDWGIVHPTGAWRPVEESLRAARLQIRQLRMHPRPAVRQSGPLILSASQWVDQQKGRFGIFADESASSSVTEWTPPGIGTDTKLLLDPRYRSKWSDVDAFSLLNAEWSGLMAGDSEQIREPGDSMRIYTGRLLKAHIQNTGLVNWLGAPGRTSGSVWLRVSQPGQQEEWFSVGSVERGGMRIIQWMPREPGLWEIQPYLIGYGKFGERLRVEVSSPPRLF